LLKQALDRPGAAGKAGDGDVRRIGAAVRFDPDPDQRLVDLLVKRSERLLRGDSGPERHRLAAAVEDAEAVEGDRESGMVDAAQRRVDVARRVPVDLADETQGQMELVLGLPARPGDPAHQGEKPGPDRRRRADRDEQAVHGRLS
jgi:hypothetical protein